MEADLAFQGVDFRDFYLAGGGPSRLSMRRLLVLVRGLPPDSATHTSLRKANASAEAARLRAKVDAWRTRKARQEAAS